MSHIAPKGEQSTSSEVSALTALTALATSGAGFAIAKTGAGTFANVAFGSISSITALTGDITATGPGSATATLATVNSNVGTFGSATQSAQIIVNAKGLITAVTAITVTPAASSITGGATLSKADDTNVTMTLGGSPTTALLAAASMTLGWTGTLSVLRGGTGGSTASITLFNNITGYSASGATGTTSTNLVFSTSPTLTTPILGQPQSGDLSNCTLLPISTGVSGLAAGIATFLATPSSANLRTAMTDETGSAALYFQGGDLGTPSAGVLTNGTGLPISTGVSGLAAGIATFLQTPSSANLKAAVTDETGSGGALVFATSPTIDTPTITTSLTFSNTSNIFALADTVSALQISANTDVYYKLDTRTSANTIAAHNFMGADVSRAAGTGSHSPTFAVTPLTVTYTGTTNITNTTAASVNKSAYFDQPTVGWSDASVRSITQANNMLINGAPISTNTNVGGTLTITESSGLRIYGPTVVGAQGAVARAYGLFISPPTGATTNFGFAVNSGGVSVIGDNTATQIGLANPQFEVVGATVDTARMGIALFDTTSADAPELTFYRSKAAGVGSATVVVNGDALGNITWFGAQQTNTTSNLTAAASIQAFVDGGVTSGASADMPGRLVFYTTPNGSGTLTEAMRINNSQNLLLVSTISQYNNVATAGYGVPSIYAAGRLTAKTAAQATVATYTVGVADGSFIISANVLVTTSTTHSFSVQCDYTDEGNTARTVTMNVQQLAGTFVTSITNLTGAGPYEGVPFHIRAKASTAITVKTTGTFTSVTYNVEGVIAQIA